MKLSLPWRRRASRELRREDVPYVSAVAAARVVEAGRLGAARIGHGVRLVDALHDPARRHLVDDVKAMGLHLEVCPTSDVHTGAAASVAQHPITELWLAGVSLSYHTDNPLMSCTSLSAPPQGSPKRAASSVVTP